MSTVAIPGEAEIEAYARSVLVDLQESRTAKNWALDIDWIKRIAREVGIFVSLRRAMELHQATENRQAFDERLEAVAKQARKLASTLEQPSDRASITGNPFFLNWLTISYASAREQSLAASGLADICTSKGTASIPRPDPRDDLETLPRRLRALADAADTASVEAAGDVRVPGKPGNPVPATRPLVRRVAQLLRQHEDEAGRHTPGYGKLAPAIVDLLNLCPEVPQVGVDWVQRNLHGLSGGSRTKTVED